MNARTLRERIFSISNEADFNNTAIEVFRFQHANNAVYRNWCDALGVSRAGVKTPGSIPFLPVSFFRNHRIVTGNGTPEIVFSSSGTTGMQRSMHHVIDASIYEESFTRSFTLFYGDPASTVIFALLPSYLERMGSSLVYMAERLIGRSADGPGGFYLDNYTKLLDDINACRREQKQVIVLGVTYALLELAEKYSPDLDGIIVMETGGMKGMRRELVREELHGILNSAFGTRFIHSEYGMTELLSQAYSKGNGIFSCPPWMKILTGDINDPLRLSTGQGSTGTINIIDLANIWSCSFISTSDLGRLHEEGTFEITGRYDNSDIRGCNLLVI